MNGRFDMTQCKDSRTRGFRGGVDLVSPGKTLSPCDM